MKKFSFILLFALFLLPQLASAATSPSLIPTATGTYSEWKPAAGVTHYTTVDETPCNGVTDYVATTTFAKRDSFVVSLASIPNNSVITAIAIAPCASRASSGGGSSVANVFYRYNAANSSDLGSYALTGTTPITLATSTWSSLSLTKTSTSTLEIGMVYTSGTKGARLSRISTQITYGQLPSATTSAASSITTTSALLSGTGNPNGTTTTAWFRIATSSPGTCNDTFGTRVPLSSGTNLGAGTSSVAYSTTTSSLTSNTTYYYCAITSNGYGKGYGGVQSFTTASLLPTATTTTATSITPTSALLNGTGNPNGTSTTAWFRIDTSTPGTCNDTFGTRVPLSSGTNLGAGTSSVAYSTTTSSLTQNTTYYYCAIASNANGKGYGGVQSFLTTSATPTIITSNITTNTTWASGTYLITTAIAINAGVTLTINPGVVVKFQDTLSSLMVYGILNANGTVGNNIYFTSYSDDSVGGDTNGNGTSTSPAAGDWSMIRTRSTGTTTLGYAVVRYTTSGIQNAGGNMTIASSTISSNINYGVYHEGGGTTTIASSAIINTTTYYGVLGTGAGKLTITTTSFINNSTTALVSLTDGLVFENSGNSASGTGINGIMIYGPTAQNQTWGAGLPYVITPSSGFQVYYGSTLTILPGAVVKFDGATTKLLNYWGTLNTLGTLTNPVTFTSYKDDSAGGDTNGDGNATTPAPGDWDTIKTNSSGITTLGYSVVHYAGQGIFNFGGNVSVASSTINSSLNYGIYHESGTTTIASSTISDTSTYYGVLGTVSGYLSVRTSRFVNNPLAAYISLSNGLIFENSGNTASGAGIKGAQLAGDMANSQTWGSGLPYIITTAFTVDSGKTLTINPGAIMKFNGASAGLTVNGTLNVKGLTGQYLDYFTSYKDDGIGGDTNGNGTTTSATAGDWDGIKVNSGGVASTSYAVVRYAGGTAGTSIWNNGGTIVLYNTEVATGTSYGINETSGNTTVIASNIHHHSVGILLADTVNPPSSIGSSWIHDNSSYGLYNSTAATSSVNSIYNYWGDASGPYNVKYNPSGTGNAVSDYIDFTPFLTEMHYLNVQDGVVRSAVDGSNGIEWGGSTAYTTAWYGAMNLWNTLGGVTVATDTLFTIEDLTLSDVDEGADSFVAAYFYNPVDTDLLKFNNWYMASSTSAYQLNATAHELGHALGLWHSYLGNMMNPYTTSTTTLGYQDILDHDYLW